MMKRRQARGTRLGSVLLTRRACLGCNPCGRHFACLENEQNENKSANDGGTVTRNCFSAKLGCKDLLAGTTVVLSAHDVKSLGYVLQFNSLFKMLTSKIHTPFVTCN